jgi:hypothetical protein
MGVPSMQALILCACRGLGIRWNPEQKRRRGASLGRVHVDLT